MPWDAKSSQCFVTLVLCTALLGSCVRMDCNNTKMTVPKPNLKYMINGDLHVTWPGETSRIGKYSVNCCNNNPESLPDYLSCHRRCPNYTKVPVSSCNLENNFCRFISKQFVNYSIYLTAEFQGCQIKGDPEEITPKLRIAHPPPSPVVNMVSESNRFVVRWDKPIDLGQMYCYLLTCHQMNGSIKLKQVYRKRHESLTVSMDFGSSHHPFTNYQCCVKVHLCLETGLYSDEVCNKSRTPAEAPRSPPEMLCGDKRKCATVVKNRSRDVTIRWKLPDKSTWNGNPKEIIVEVRAAGENTTVKHVINVTATEYILRGLKLDVDYHVYLSLCNEGGCSSISTQVLLRAEQKTDDTVNIFNTRVLIITVTISILAIALAILVCSRRNRRTQTNATLPNIIPPDVENFVPGSGESVATSIGVNANYNELNVRHDTQGSTDNISLRTNASDTCSLDSNESFSSRPLLSAEKKTAKQDARPRVTVTYLPQRPGTLTSLNPNISYDEGSQFV